jgi:tetratricopeptide (TPR) repeat protein
MIEATSIALPEVKIHIRKAYIYLCKRKFTEALKDCESAIKLMPDLKVAHELREMIQEKHSLYRKGNTSGFVGFFTIYLLQSAFQTAGAHSQLTTLGGIALFLSVLLIVEGFFVAYSGLRVGFLVDSILIGVIGLSNVGMGLSINPTNFFIMGLGILQLIGGITGLVDYRRKPSLNYQEIKIHVTDFLVLPAARQHFNMALKSLKKKLYEDGLQECESALCATPDYAEAHNLRGFFLNKLGRSEEVIQTFREAVRFDPDFTEARRNLADAEKKLAKSKRG